MDISKKILSDPVNRWVFNNGEKDIFIVGGYIRDILLGKKTKDKDFVLKKNAKKIAIKAAKKFNGTFIIFRNGTIYRVVIKHKKGAARQGQLISGVREVLDFSNLTTSINNDLKDRDFTINAIAWSPETGIIDPAGGRKDLKNRIVTAVRAKNLGNDPLRTIRAYRIAAELGFRIEKHTREKIKRYAHGLTNVAPERITEEFFKILSNNNSFKYLLEFYKDKVLDKILNTPDVGNSNILSRKIKFLGDFDSFLKKECLKIPEGKKITAQLNEEISQCLNRIGLLRLALLLTGEVITIGRLKISKNINKALRDIHNVYNEVVLKRSRTIKKISHEELYKTFSAAGDRVLETAIILSFITGKNLKWVLKKADEFLKIKNKILLNGNDVQKLLKIKPGTALGKILSSLKEQQFKGLIKTKAEAKRWLAGYFT